MLIHLTFGSTQPTASGDVIDALLECHARIRHHSALAVKVARGEGGAEARQEALGQLLRYFGKALPLHAEDEDASLLPRLRAAGVDSQVETALETMRVQHLEIDARLAGLMACWQPMSLDQPCGCTPEALLEGSLALEALFRDHLAIEETTIFPAVRAHLPAAEQEGLREEMRRRREPKQ